MRLTKKIGSAVWNLCNLGTKAGDTDQERLKKSILTLITTIIAFLAIFWGLLYIKIGYPVSGAIPLSYSAISFVSIAFFLKTKHFVFFRFTQFLLIFLLPFVVMWSLGGFANSGAVMVWSFFTPLAAMFFINKNQLNLWLIAFVLFTLISGFIDPYVKALFPPMDPATNTLLFVMNISIGFISLYLIILYFINDRGRAHFHAVQAKEHAIASQEKLQQLNEKLSENDAKIRELMLTDILTGIPNRRHLEDKLKQEFERVARYSRQLAVVMLDIDYFKSVNDDFGHGAGDKVLQQLAKLMVKETRDVDFVARIGGEEFVMLLPESDAESAKKTVERIRKKFASLNFSEIDRQVTASFGIALAQKDESGHECLMRADTALYQSKKSGRNKVTVA